MIQPWRMRRVSGPGARPVGRRGRLGHHAVPTTSRGLAAHDERRHRARHDRAFAVGDRRLGVGDLARELATPRRAPRARRRSSARAGSGTTRRGSRPGRPTRARCWRRSSWPRRGSRRTRRRARCRTGCRRARWASTPPPPSPRRSARSARRAARATACRRRPATGPCCAPGEATGHHSVRLRSHAHRRRRRRHPHAAREAQRAARRAGTRSTSLAHVLSTLVLRNDLDPALVDDVITGCVSQVGEQALNVSRNALLAAGFPDSVPGTTVDRQCGSSQQALHFAAQGVIAGAYDVVIAAGVESMTRVPMGSSVLGADPFGTRLVERYPEPRAAGHLGRAHRREVGLHPRGARRVRARVAAARARVRPTRRASTASSCRCRSWSTGSRAR